MIKRIESVAIFSENARKLAEFYENEVGFKITLEAEIGDKGEELFEIKFGDGSGFYIIDHSEIKDKSKDPKRIIINFEVDNIEKKISELKSKGVNIIQDVYHMENYGLIATLEDLDGNYFQLVQVTPLE